MLGVSRVFLPILPMFLPSTGFAAWAHDIVIPAIDRNLKVPCLAD